MDKEYKRYRKKTIQWMRPYIEGEDLYEISVSPEDVPQKGGMIAINEKNFKDKWYVNHTFFRPFSG